MPFQSNLSDACSEAGSAVTSTVLAGGRVATYQRLLLASLQHKGGYNNGIIMKTRSRLPGFGEVTMGSNERKP